MLMVLKKIIFLPLEFRMKQKNRNQIKMRSFNSFFVGLVMVLIALPASSQTLELGLFGGGSYYLGELNPGLHFSGTQLSYGALARLNLNKRWAFRFSYYRGKLQSDDTKNAFIPNNGLNFQSVINDFSLVAEFNFLEYFTGSKKTYITPYIFAGIGFFTFNPKSLDGVVLQPLGTEGQNVGFDGRSPYNKWGLSFPFGIGIKYSLSERFGLGVEWGMRKTFTDYIDDISTSYYLDGPEIDPNNEAAIHSDPTMNHEPYMQRGNSKNWDWFNFFGVSVTYKINLKSRRKCNLDGW
jgi:hypothetical protein